MEESSEMKIESIIDKSKTELDIQNIEDDNLKNELINRRNNDDKNKEIDEILDKNGFSVGGEEKDFESINEGKKEYDEKNNNIIEMNNLKQNLINNKFSEFNLQNQDETILQNQSKDLSDDFVNLNIDDFNHQLVFEKNEITHDLIIQNEKFFEIKNITIINISENKSFDILYMYIDENNSSKNILFDPKNPRIYRITSMSGALLKREKLESSPRFYIKEQKIGKYTIYIYLREKPNGDNLSPPLKITINLIEDPENIERKEEEEEIQDYFKREEDNKRIQEENENIDYKGLDKIKVEQLLNDLDEEFNILSMRDKKEVINKIIEFNCDKQKINNWICDIF